MVKLYNGIKDLVNNVIKIRKHYKLAVKIKNIVLKVLNLCGSGYSLFISVEPFLNKDKDKSKIIEVK